MKAMFPTRQAIVPILWRHSVLLFPNLRLTDSDALLGSQVPARAGGLHNQDRFCQLANHQYMVISRSAK